MDEVFACVEYCQELLNEGPLNDERGAYAKVALHNLAQGAFAYCELLGIDPTKWAEVAPHILARTEVFALGGGNSRLGVAV